MRFIVAALIAWTAWWSPADAAVRTVVLLILLAWTPDTLDRPLAHRAAGPRHTWLGADDLEVDLSVTLAMTVSLALLGAAPTSLPVGMIIASEPGWSSPQSLAPVNFGMGLAGSTAEGGRPSPGSADARLTPA